MFISVDCVNELDLRLMRDSHCCGVQRSNDGFELTVLDCVWTVLLLGLDHSWQDDGLLVRVGGYQCWRLAVAVVDCCCGMADVGEGSMLGVLVDIVHRFIVFLLVMYEAAGVRSSPGTLVTLVGMLPCVSPPVIDQVVRSLKLLATKVTCVSKLCFVDQLMFLE